MKTVYLSSTYSDLVRERKAVRDAISQSQHFSLRAMEDYTAGDERPVEKCLRDVEQCHIYIGIFAWRYGYIPPADNPDSLSITEMEYRKAVELKKSRLLFFLREGVAWPDEFTEKGDGQNKIQRLRAELSEHRLVGMFSDSTELVGRVMSSLINLLAPALPTQRIVGSLSLELGKYFKDRTEENAKLTACLNDNSVRMVTILGRSGIGKSALASKVLADILESESTAKNKPGNARGIVIERAATGTECGRVTLEKIFQDFATLLGQDENGVIRTSWKNSAQTVQNKVSLLWKAVDDPSYILFLDEVDSLLDDQRSFKDPELRTLVHERLAHPNGARLLVTSRSPIALPPELARFNRLIWIENGLPLEDAITLIQEMCSDDEGNSPRLKRPSLKKAAQRLGGIPKALELFAGALASPTSDVETLLSGTTDEDILDDLARATYSGLTPRERRILEALAVLDLPVEFDALESTLRPFVNPSLKLAELDHLILNRMVNLHRGPRNRFSLQIIEREFARRHLVSDANYSITILERQAAAFYSGRKLPPEQWHNLEDLEPHFRAFHHHLGADQVELAAKVICEVDISTAAALGLTRTVQALYRRVDGRVANPEIQMRLSYGLAKSHMYLGEPLEAAIPYAQKAKALATPDFPEIARDSSLCIADVFRRIGRIDLAIQEGEKAMELPSPSPDKPDSLPLLLTLAYTYGRKFKEAYELGSRFLERVENSALTDKNIKLGQAHNALAPACLRMGKPEIALHHTEKSILFYKAANDLEPYAYLLNLRAMALTDLGDLQKAEQAFKDANKEAVKTQNPRAQGFSDFNLARLLRKKGQHPEALKLADRCLKHFQTIGAMEAAAATAFKAAVQADTSGNPGALVISLLNCGRACNEAADLLPPADLFREALDRSRLLENAAIVKDIERELDTWKSLTEAP